MERKLKPYCHEQKIKRRNGYANSDGAHISESHTGISVFALVDDNCGFAHRPTSVLIPWATIKAALRRKRRHELDVVP